MSRVLGPALLAVCLSSPLRAAEPQFWKVEGASDFLQGSVEGVSIDSEGHLRLAPEITVLHDPEAPYVWCVTRDRKGVLYVGTGNDGKVFRIEAGKASLLFDAPELEVHALAVAPDGRVFVATSPDGKVYAVDAAGSVETFYDPSEKYIWGLAFDPQERLLVATGSGASLYRVDKEGAATLLFSSPETHLTALAVDGKGVTYAGSAPDGIVYRIDASGKVFVLDDTAYREIKSLQPAADGSLFVAAVDAKEDSSRAAPPATAPTAAMPAQAPEVIVTEAFSLPAPSAAAPAQPARPLPASRTSAPKGAVLRVLPTGEVDTLWTSAEDMPHSLLTLGEGVLVGTGDKGKVYGVRTDRTWTMVASFPADQVTGLHHGEDDAVLAVTANPGKVYSIAGRPGREGTFTSPVKDAEAVSTWGRVRWEASVPPGATLSLQTRSGNTSDPDSTWSEWSAAYAQKGGDPVTSDRARFIQLRATLGGKDGVTPVLHSVSVAYLQRNLRPEVEEITVHPPGEVFQRPLTVTGELEILGLDPSDAPEPRPAGSSVARPRAGPVTSYSRRLYQRGIQTFTWKASDPNGDTLVYDVYYRAVGDERYRPLRTGLSDPVLAWDTSTVPNGRYTVKVQARDTPSNPESLALDGAKESAPFDVDNTPPNVTATLIARKPARVRAVVKDDSSLIRKGEFSVDGGSWREVHPVDGINDASEETYEFDVAEKGATGPRTVVVRATDLLGNTASARVEVP
jgi:outer membrane protein assembly factor BamB